MCNAHLDMYINVLAGWNLAEDEHEPSFGFEMPLLRFISDLPGHAMVQQASRALHKFSERFK